MPYIEIIRATYVDGKPAEVGDVFEVDAETAKLGVETRKAKIVDGPGEALVEPPKPKAKKISKPKPAAPQED